MLEAVATSAAGDHLVLQVGEIQAHGTTRGGVEILEDNGRSMCPMNLSERCRGGEPYAVQVGVDVREVRHRAEVNTGHSSALIVSSAVNSVDCHLPGQSTTLTPGRPL